MINPEWTPGVVQLACISAAILPRTVQALYLRDSCKAIKSKARALAHDTRITSRGCSLLYIVAPMIAGGLSVLLLLVLISSLSCRIGPKQIFLLTLKIRGPNSRKP